MARPFPVTGIVLFAPPGMCDTSHGAVMRAVHSPQRHRGTEKNVVTTENTEGTETKTRRRKEKTKKNEQESQKLRVIRGKTRILFFSVFSVPLWFTPISRFFSVLSVSSVVKKIFSVFSVSLWFAPTSRFFSVRSVSSVVKKIFSVVNSSVAFSLVARPGSRGCVPGSAPSCRSPWRRRSRQIFRACDRRPTTPGSISHAWSCLPG